MDLLRLCRELRKLYPKPIKADCLIKYLDANAKDCSQSQIEDVTNSIGVFWRRLGWFIDANFAIILEPDEEALFHEKGITIIKTPESLPTDQVLLKFIPLGQENEKVVWF